jgi:hypothetical protein
VGQLVRALAFAAVLAPAAERAQQDSAATQHAPPSPIDGYAITGSETFPDSSQGTVFRYTKAGQARIDVFIYPYAAPLPPLIAAMGEAGTFRASLPLLQQKGYFESYRIAFSTTDTTHTDGGVVLGSLVAVALKQRGQIVVTFQYVYGLHDNMLKARVDVPQAQLAYSDARTFVHDLVARVTAGR